MAAVHVRSALARIISKMLLGHRASDFWEWYDDVPSYGSGLSAWVLDGDGMRQLASMFVSGIRFN